VKVIFVAQISFGRLRTHNMNRQNTDLLEIFYCAITLHTKASDAKSMLSLCGNEKAPKKKTVKTQTYFKFTTNSEYNTRPNYQRKAQAPNTRLKRKP
jgi:hypothetical protein